MLQTLSFGVLPTREAFDSAFDAECPTGYRIQLSGSDSRACDGLKLGDGTWTSDQLWNAISEIMNASADEITVSADDDLENVYEICYQQDVWPFYCAHYTARDAGHDSAPFLEIGPDDSDLVRHAAMFREYVTSNPEDTAVTLSRAISCLNFASAYGTVGHDYAKRDAAMDLVSSILETLGFEWV